MLTGSSKSKSKTIACSFDFATKIVVRNLILGNLFGIGVQMLKLPGALIFRDPDVVEFGEDPRVSSVPIIY